MEFPAPTPQPHDNGDGDGDGDRHQCPCRSTSEDCIDFLVVARGKLPPDTYIEFLRVAKDLRNYDCNFWENIRKVEYLLKGHSDLLSRFAAFLPEHEKQVFIKRIPGYSRATDFVEKVKNYFIHVENRYDTFVDTMHRSKEMTKEERDRKIEEIFECNSELIEEFHSFFPHLASSCGSPEHQDEGETGNGFAHAKKFNVERDWKQQHLEERHDETRTRDAYIDRSEEDFQNSQSMDEDIRMEMDLKEDDTEHESFSDSDCNRARETLGEVCTASTQSFSYKKCMLNSNKTNILRNAELCTPSYRFLPKNYPILPASKRTSLGVSVLNDVVVSVTSGSEGSFKLRNRNQYEEILFRCEDDRYELDMLLESCRATVKKMEKLLEVLQDDENPNEHGIEVQEYLTSRNMRCIEGIYGYYGLDIVNSLCKKPSATLPVILIRLKQKQEIWLISRLDFQKTWYDVFAKNYRKSLDHRGFYFKQQDASNLSAKALLAEIKEVKQKKQNEDDALVSSITGNSPYGVHDMEFEYPDIEIHEDMYNIIKFSCNEFCSSEEQFDKIMTIWTTFLEPIFGVSPLLQATEPSHIDQDSDIPLITGSYDNNDMYIEASTSSSEIGEIQDGNRITTEYGYDDFGSQFDDSNERFHKISDEGKGSEEDNNAEVEDKETSDADDSEGHEIPLSFSGPHLDALRPLNVHSDKESHIQDYNSRIFYGNSSFYMLFRLHQILYERIHCAKINSFVSRKELAGPLSSKTVDNYARFMNALYSLLGRNIDNSKFEDECRDIVGSQSYMLFTLDKLIQQIIKQLQAIASSKADNQLLQLYEYETSRKRGSFYDLLYNKDARILHDGDLFRFECSADAAKFSIKYMELGNRDHPNTVACLNPDNATYLYSDFLTNVQDNKEHDGIFLRRNIRKMLGDDEPSTAYGAMEGVQILNGLQCNFRSSLKIFYVLDTEDILFRARNKRKAASSKGRRSRWCFHEFLLRHMRI